eukprot:6636685-Alexandrium_andersonii.AAC.1
MNCATDRIGFRCSAGEDKALRGSLRRQAEHSKTATGVASGEEPKDDGPVPLTDPLKVPDL